MKLCEQCNQPMTLTALMGRMTLDTYPEMNAYVWTCENGHTKEVYLTYENAAKESSASDAS